MRKAPTLLLLCLAAASSAQAPQPRNQTEQTNRAEGVGRALESIATAQNKIAQSTATGEYQKPCGEGETNNRSDLCAQWHAASAARDAADWAEWSFIVGLVGAVGVVVALILTAASNRIASRTARLQLRPYVLPLNPRIKPAKGEPEDTWSVKIQIRNGGTTPARNVCCQLETEYRELPLPRDASPRPGLAVEFAYIGPNETRYLVGQVTIIADREARIRRLEAVLLLQVWIKYEFFKNERDEVTHKYIVVGKDFDTGKIRVLSEWAHQHPKPNEEGQGQLSLAPPTGSIEEPEDTRNV